MSGLTLVELMVVLALLGLFAGVAGLAIAHAPSVAGVDETAARIAEARARALAEARPVTIAVAAGGRISSVTVSPDGSVRADSGIVVDQLTGRAPHAPR